MQTIEIKKYKPTKIIVGFVLSPALPPYFDINIFLFQIEIGDDTKKKYV